MCVEINYFVLFICHLVSFLKRPATPLATLGMNEYQSADHEQLMKRLRPAQPVEEVTLISICMSSICT